jgi:hypothetical protein
MTVGDTIGAVTVGGAWVSFQPALGVECVITSMIGSNWGWNNGTIEAVTSWSQNPPTPAGSQNIKIMVSNSIYYRYYSASNQGFTGLQIK